MFRTPAQEFSFVVEASATKPTALKSAAKINNSRHRSTVVPPMTGDGLGK